MQNNIVCRAYFSPNGSTKRIMECIAKEFQGIRLICDFLKPTLNVEINLTAQDLLIIGVPSFSGRVPKICKQQIEQMHGNNTPAIIYVTYGNRDYDDTLIELKETITKNGFRVLTAAAFVCEHSIFHEVAKHRPDIKDMREIAEFAEVSKYIYANYSDKYTQILQVRGNTSYRKAMKIPFVPQVNDSCSSCGICATVCPTRAISKKHPQKTSRLKCIACTACIHVCPNKARGFRGTVFHKTQQAFEEKNMKLKKNEIFI